MKVKKRHILFSFLLTAILMAVSLLYFPLDVNSPIGQKIEPPAKIIKILFVGDLMFDRGIRYYAAKNGGNNFIFSAQGARLPDGQGPASGWETLSDFLKSHNLVVANLEGPITDNKSISVGSKPGSSNNYFFTFDPSVAKTLFEHNIKIVSLGNNHILNFGQAGLKTTQEYLKEAGVEYFGAPGEMQGLIRIIDGVKFGFVSYNQVNEQKIEDVENEIKSLKSACDIVIVFSHWGAEYMPNPADITVAQARRLIDAGADLIIGSHPHVIQPMEIYKEKRIYYSLGNFIFDQYFSEEVRKGLGVQVKINSKTKQLDFEEKNFYLGPEGQTILLEKTP